MQLIPIKTRILQPPKDDLYAVLDTALGERLKERDVLVVTSKIVSIGEGRGILITDTIEKDDLVIQESDAYLPAEKDGEWNISIKHSTILLSAGIDESNARGHYLLLPKDPYVSAQKIRSHLMKKCGIKELGVIISDSHSIPFRYGTLGVSLGFAGIEPVRHFSGKLDLFGREFKYTRINVVDSIAASAVFLMGETTEQTPLCIARNAPYVTFVGRIRKKDLLIPPQEDIYYPLLKKFYERNNNS